MAQFSLDRDQNRKAIGQGALKGGAGAGISGMLTGAGIGATAGAAVTGPAAPIGALAGGLIGGAIGLVGAGGLGAAAGGAMASAEDKAAQKDAFEVEQETDLAEQDAAIDSAAMGRSSGGRKKSYGAADYAMPMSSNGLTGYDRWKAGY